MTDAALLQGDDGLLPGTEPSVQAMFEILGAKIHVISASVGLLRRWVTLYEAFRTRPGVADITVAVGCHGDADEPRPGEAVVIVGDAVRPWTGAEPLFPPLWVPPLDRWLHLRGTAVGRAGQAVLLLSRPNAGKTLLAVALVARGAWLLADELVPLDPADLLVAPFPKSLRLRRGALELLGIDLAHPALLPFRAADGGIEWRAEPGSLFGARSSRVAADVGALVFLEHHGDAGANGADRNGGGASDPSAVARLDPLRPREALARLATQLHQAPKDFQVGMEALVRLCNRAPAYSLVPAHPAASARLLDEALLA
ncbi:MAG TPA: hypothetical protein VFD04_24280 [Actinomycetes bacterium]|nr:hypothetical protein [Actinomycetes bacterium]